MKFFLWLEWLIRLPFFIVFGKVQGRLPDEWGPKSIVFLDASREIKSSNYTHIDHDIIYHSIPQMLMYCLSS